MVIGKLKLSSRGEITIATLLVIAGISVTVALGEYNAAQASINRVDKKVDDHITKDADVYGRLGNLEAKMDLLLKSQGIDVSKVKK
jgi:hypothetical protein